MEKEPEHRQCLQKYKAFFPWFSLTWPLIFTSSPISRKKWKPLLCDNILNTKGKIGKTLSEQTDHFLKKGKLAGYSKAIPSLL